MMNVKGLGALLRFAHLSSNILLTKALAPYKLSVEQWILLNIVQYSPQSQKDLAAWIQSEQSSITRMVDTMEKNGYVQRIAHTQDRRSKLVIITQLGKEQLAIINPMTERMSEDLNTVFTHEELTTLLTLLQKLIDRNNQLLNTSQSVEDC